MASQADPDCGQRAMIEHIAGHLRRTARWTGCGALSPRVMAALARVPRERFVPSDRMEAAHADSALAIGHGQTISQPFIVALMTELLDVSPDANVLEVGTGSGYQTAVLARLTRHLCSVEIVPELAHAAAARLAVLGLGGVALRTGDGAQGWAERAPFDRIMVTAAAPHVPPALLDQLGPGGRMAIPIGPAFGAQSLRVLEKQADGAVTNEFVLDVTFVPLTNGEAVPAE